MIELMDCSSELFLSFLLVSLCRHRCWTRNKYDKLHNFRQASMWFVTEEASEVLGSMGNTTFTASHREFLDVAMRYEKQGMKLEDRLERTVANMCKI